MGYGIEMDHDQIIKGKGYAAAMALNVESGKNKEIAVALSNQSGIKLEIFSDRPSLQIYNAWLFDGKDTGKSGKGYMFSGGFVMEPQGYPDAPNHSNFPSIVLRPGELYHHTDIYRFSTFK
jgi:aldose 1-epimerase